MGSSSSSAANFSPTWPAGVQAGDVVVCCMLHAPDTGGTSASITSAPGWKFTTTPGAEPRFMWCIYTPAQALPVFALTGGCTATWRTLAFRSTKGVAFGRDWHADGVLPPTTDLTTLTPNTLLVVFGSAVGDQPASWSFGGSGWTGLVSNSGNGSGNVNYPNVGIAWQQVSTPAALTGLRALLNTNRYFLLEVGESQFAGGFFE